MPYATQQNMIDRFGDAELIQLTDPVAGAINATTLDKALADASAEIDGYLAARYALPLTTVPTLLERLTCDMSRYYLYADRVTELVRQRYDDAVRFLRDVGAGKVNLNLDVTAHPAVQTSGPKADAPERIFTDETLETF